MLGWTPAVSAVEQEAREQPASDIANEVPTVRGSFLGYRTAIRIALERHPLIRKSEHSADSAAAVAEQARSKYYPELNAYAIQTGGTIRPLSAFNIAGAQNKPTSYVESAGLRADQLLYDFGQTAHKVLAESAGQEAAEKDVLTQKALAILRVQQAYIHCLRQARLVQIAEETVRERGVLRDQIAVLYKRELKSKLDLDLISVELRNAEVQLLQARNERRAAFAALNNAMGIRGSEEYTLEEAPLSESIPGNLESLITQAVEERPEVLGASERIRQATEQLKSAQALNLPTISAQGMYGVIHFSDAPLNQYAGSHPGQTNLWWGAGASVSFPIFTGFLIENRVADARAQRYKREQVKIELTNRISLEMTDAYLSLQSARQQIRVAEQEVASARSALTLAKERYRLGLASIVDVTTATTALLIAEVRLSEARYAVQTAVAAVDYARGRSYQLF
jgi:outer membrane protein